MHQAPNKKHFGRPSPAMVVALLALACAPSAAAHAFAARGGYLPGPLALYSVRGVLNLGTGTGNNHTFTDSYYANPAGVNYRTVVLDGTGAITEQSVDSPCHYLCAYALLR